jgi:hypothetical protein
MRGAAIKSAALAALVLALALPSAQSAYAQDSIAFNEDDFFGSEDELFIEVEEAPEGTVGASLLVYDQVRVGGSVSGNATASWTWDDPYSSFALDGFDAYSLEPSLSSTLFFDARPTEDARFYGSMKMGWPFETTKTFLTGAEYTDDIDGPFLPGTDPGILTESGKITAPNATVFELFTDFNYDDKLFFRFGKQTVNWGVGYFFSPANIINLQAIDPFNPDAQLEGPVSLRAHYPIPGSQHNVWAYATFDSPDMKPEDIAVAAKGEFVLGAWELGAGLWYRYDSPLRGIVTASGSIRDLTLFGEGYLARGSDKTFVTQVDDLLPGFVATEQYDEQAFFKGSAGFMWSKSDWNLTLAGQYLYDGEGYADVDREARIDEAYANEAQIKLILATLPTVDDVDAAFSGFVKGLIAGSGRHYAAFSVSKSELFLDDLSASAFVLANLSDFSGLVRPSLSYRLFKGMSASVSASFAFGGADSEYIVLNDGPAMSWSFGLSLGSGSF